MGPFIHSANERDSSALHCDDDCGVESSTRIASRSGRENNEERRRFDGLKIHSLI